MIQFVQQAHLLKSLNTTYKSKRHIITFYNNNYKDLLYKRQIYKIINDFIKYLFKYFLNKIF